MKTHPQFSNTVMRATWWVLKLWTSVSAPKYASTVL